MKKRDEIEDEILDEEEFLDDEEVLDDEEFDDDDFIDDEEEEDEDEKPSKKAKKSKKGGKKKLGKGAVIGISVGSVVAFLAIAVVLVVFVILPMMGGSADASGAGSYTATIGAKAPTGVTAKQAINKNMNTYQMLDAAVQNYYAADYAANVCVIGGVKTTVLGIKVNQGVQSFKYRDGKGNPTDSSNKENAKYYAYSKSSGIATLYEEYFTEGSTVKHRKAASTKTAKYEVPTANGKKPKVEFMVASKWNKATTYTDVSKFIEATSTDFTKVWSYKVDETTVLNADEKVKYNSEEDIYYLKASLDLDKATADYLDVMKYQLATNMNMEVKSLKFNKLELECAIYGNGFFKYIIIHEAYEMNLGKVPVIGDLNGMVIANNYINEYSFDKSEALPYEVLKDGKVEKSTFDFETLKKQYK